MQVEILALLRFLKVTKVQGMSREDSGKVQGFREGSGKVQGRCRECSGRVQGRFREGSGKVLNLF